jgi:plastocyanin
MRIAPILRLFPAAALAISIAGCARCPYPQTSPAPVLAGSQLPGARPPAPLEPSRVEPGDNQVVAADTPRVTLVRMLTTRNGAAGEFAPRVVRVRRGDLVRFQLADGNAVHNVSFTWQGNRSGVQLPADSPMLVQEGQSWQLRVDLPPGTYEFACIPHALMHMQGTLIVEP